MFRCVALCVGVVCVVAGVGQGAIIPLTATLDGAQANAGLGTGSPGTGSATMTLDTNTNLFSWNIAWSGLLGTETAAHFHGPALPTQNAGIQIGITAVSPSIGAAVISAGQAADLISDLWYINIHTTGFPGGEIRGQVTPEPASAALLAMGGLAAMRHRRR